MIGKIVMTVAQLLAWATEETNLADAMERMIPTMPEDLHPLLRQQATLRRERSRWLDQQVADWLDAEERRASSP